MTKRQDRGAISVKRQFDTETIVLSRRWYITYRLSYPDLNAPVLMLPTWSRRAVQASWTTSIATA
jgi:hypothetical protein